MALLISYPRLRNESLETYVSVELRQTVVGEFHRLLRWRKKKLVQQFNTSFQIGHDPNVRKKIAAASALSIVDLVNHQRERRHSGPHYDRVGFRAWNSLQRDWSLAGLDGRLQQWFTHSRRFARRHIAACLSILVVIVLTGLTAAAVTVGWL